MSIGGVTLTAGQIVGSFYFPLEMISAAVLFSRPLKRRGYFWLRMAVGLVLSLGTCTLLMSLYTVLVYLSPVFGLGDVSYITMFWCGVLFLTCVVLVWRVHAVRFREALYCGACAYLMEHMAYCVRILYGQVLPEEALRTGSIGYYLIHIVVYAAVYALFARNMIEDGRLMATVQDSLVLTLATLAVVMGMSIAVSAYGFELAHAVYALFCCCAVLYGQLKQQKDIKSRSELALQRQMWSVHKAQYEMSRENIDIINRKCHDLKHQVAALKHIHDPDRREEVIDSLQSAVMIYDAMLETGNEILDTVLTEKSLICAQREIALSCMADGEQLAFLDPVDLYTLVGNALDNAIEATELLPPEERSIRLRVQEKAGLVFFQIENPYPGTLELRDGLPLTRKEDKQDHGFGLKSIRDVGEKYHGLLTLETEGGLFVLRLSFPLCEQQLTAEK